MGNLPRSLDYCDTLAVVGPMIKKSCTFRVHPIGSFVAHSPLSQKQQILYLKRMIKAQVGSRIKELRTQQKMSQETFASLVGIDRTYLASVEKGKRNISIINLYKIWIGLKITPKDFFDADIFREEQ